MWSMRNIWQDWRGDTRGTAMLEMAVVLPVLLAIGLGVFEFGNLIYKYHLITVGIRDGARYAAGLPAGSADAAAKNIATTGVVSGGTNRVADWIPNDVIVSYSTVANGPTSCGSVKCYRGGDNITMVTLSTSETYQDLGFLGYFGLGPITLNVSHQERLFGVR